MKELAGLIATKTAITIPVVLIAGLLFLLILCLIIAILFYIFKSIGIFRIAKDQGVKAYGLAWLPLFDWLILGRSADHIRKKDGAEHSGFGGWIFFLSLVVLAGDIATLVATGNLLKGDFVQAVQKAFTNVTWILPVVIVSAFCSIAIVVLKIVALSFVFQELSKAYVALIILSIIFAWLVPVFLFAVRKNGKKEEEIPYEEIPPIGA